MGLALTKKTLSALGLSAGLMWTAGVQAEQSASPALLVVGASMANGDLPLQDDMQGVWGGLNVGLGSYLDLGKALIKDARLPGYVINEGVAGASTLAHRDCSLSGGTVCSDVKWISFDQQFDRALRRVTNFAQPGTYNADYVVITHGNDCMHSNNYDVPEVQTTPCTAQEMNEYVDRLIALGQRALDVGITPIYTAYPPSEALDFERPRPFYWFIDQSSWDTLGDLHAMRIQSELSGAVYLNNVWDGFVHNGDGLHPDDKTARKAAEEIAQYIINNP